MKELTREELPDDGTHFVVTWSFKGRRWGRTGALKQDHVFLFCDEDDCFTPQIWRDCTNIRYWQFPEGETK